MKSPFLVIPNFISPKTCEEIVKQIYVAQPDIDVDGRPIPLRRHHEPSARKIFPAVEELIPQLEQRYNVRYRGTESLLFEHYPERLDAPAKLPGCENAKFIRKKWVKINDIDLTGYIWLKDFNDHLPIDLAFEIYGGKLEFPAYNFSFMPQRGTLVLFPAGPHFITAISPVLVGDLYQVKINISVETKNGGMFLYQPSEFAGRWQDWLQEFI